MKVNSEGFEFGRFELVVCSALAFAHACFFFWDRTHDAWGIFLLLVDLPISIPLSKFRSPVPFLIGGTLWWFFLGYFVSMLLRGSHQLIVRSAIWLARGSKTPHS
jgi:hypothetical protein